MTGVVFRPNQRDHWHNQTVAGHLFRQQLRLGPWSWVWTLGDGRPRRRAVGWQHERLRGQPIHNVRVCDGNGEGRVVRFRVESWGLPARAVPHALQWPSPARVPANEEARFDHSGNRRRQQRVGSWCVLTCETRLRCPVLLVANCYSIFRVRHQMTNAGNMCVCVWLHICCDCVLGTFYEGFMTTGLTSDDTDVLVQANIVAAGYGV